MSEIQVAFQGAHVFITGATGFMGQVLTEKLLRTCHHLEQVYLLARPKKGLSEEERFEKIFDGYLYARLKTEQPDFLKKVKLIAGDCGKPGLGISDSDKELLKQNVNFVFHGAATVRFDEKLHIAYKVNVLGTKELLQFSREMINLKAFIHISTAYANCPEKNIDENFYEPGMKWNELEQLSNSLSEANLNAITPLVIDRWPNTYSFSKCIAEDVIREFGAGLPIAVIRPSIVMSTAYEPIRNWINNVYGAAGVAAGAAMGLIRVMRANTENVVDLVPADMAIHCSIAAAWEVATTKPSTPMIYNYVSAVQKSITFGQYMEYLKDAPTLPSVIAVWTYFLILVNNRHLYKIWTIILHTLPALIFDSVAVISGKKPRLLRGYLKVHKFTTVTSYFSIQEWNFKNDNVMALWDKMSKKDKLLFNFNLTELDWYEYLAYLLRGMRLYTFNESYDADNLKRSFAHYQKLIYANTALVKILQLLPILFTYLFAKFLYTRVIYT